MCALTAPGRGCWDRMGCCSGYGTKKVENHWFSATVSNAQQRLEQSFRDRTQGKPWEKSSHLARTFACSKFHLLSLWWLCLFIRKSCAYTCWKKWRLFYIFLDIQQQSWWKVFLLKMDAFTKIYLGCLSFFRSWRHFLDTSQLTKILEGTLIVGRCRGVIG